MSDLVGGPPELAGRDLGQGAKRHAVFRDVTTGGDVGLFMHRNDMRVEMRNVAAGKKKRHAGDPIKLLQGDGDSLSKQYDRADDLSRCFVETLEMITPTAATQYSSSSPMIALSANPEKRYHPAARGSHCDKTLQGGHHAREVLRLDDNGRHCWSGCHRFHFGVRHAGVGSRSEEHTSELQ